MKKIFEFLISTVIFLMVNESSAQSWSAQNSGTTNTLWQIQFLNALNGYACGEAGAVLKTSNGGTDWSAVNINTTNPVRDIFFVSDDEGWAAVGDENNNATSGEIWHTVNGGTDWTQQTASTIEARFGIGFTSANEGWAVGSMNGPINIDATTDGGANWTNQSNNGIFGWLYKIDVQSATTAYVIGGTFFPSVTGFVISTTDGGTNWNQLNTGSIPFANGIDFTNSTTGFIVGDGGYISSTTNSGANWTPLISGTNDTLGDVSFISTINGWACGNNGTIIRSDDGASWNSETTGSSEHLHGIFAFDADNVWAVGDGGTILKRGTGSGIPDFDVTIFHTEIFPNPFHSTTTLSVTTDLILQNATLMVFDSFGRKWQENIFSGNRITVERKNLDAGIYFFSISVNENIVSRGKLIIQ